jgi:YVTN family beta-propeller protein
MRGRGTALGLAAAFALPLLGAAAATTVVLPTEWSIGPAQAQVTDVPPLPESARLTADGKHLVVLIGGNAGSSLSFLDPGDLHRQAATGLSGAFGDVAPDPKGDGFWAAGGGSDTLYHVLAELNANGARIALPRGFWASAVVVSPDATLLATSGDQADEVAFVDPLEGKVTGIVKTGSHPNGLAFSLDSKTLYVANWGAKSVSVVDVAARSVRATIPVGDHPEALLLSPDGKRLYVSETDDDTIGVIDTARNERIGGANVGLYGGTLFGASPTAMALSHDGARLFVACSAANAIAVLNVGPDGMPHAFGALPVGWYPTAVTLDATGNGLYVANGMGETTRANPDFDPYAKPLPRWLGYDARSLIGSVRRVPIPSDDRIVAGIAAVRALAGPFMTEAIDQPDVRMRGPKSDEPGRSVVRYGGPIKHVIYIIKENRTYDQVLGDVPGADGDPNLAYFGGKVTPNQHALAARFGIFDATFADAVVSADGHNWSMGAFANDYLEKTWPPNYGGRRIGYDFEDGADASVPHSGFLWNAAARGGVSFRDYGEFVTNPARKGDDVTTHMPDLIGHIDPRYIGFDTAYSDRDREAEWAREFDGYVKNGDLPALEIVRLPNDHTAGTTPGSRSPIAMVAENDLALGRLVDAVSHSKYWNDTAIFAIEDDAQNGPDHVNDHRTTFYLASPWAKGGLQHARYSTAGIVRTIELILGLPPMSSYDASARPLYAAFTDKPDARPFEALPAQTDLEAFNGPNAYRARDSAKMDFTHADAAPQAELNDILAHAR